MPETEELKLLDFWLHLYDSDRGDAKKRRP
jgi:hypothetical protein